MIRLLVLAGICTLFLAACQTEPQDPLSKLEMQVAKKPTDENVKQLLDLYHQRLADLPDPDSSRKVFLDKTLDVAMKNGREVDALNALTNLAMQYPKDARTQEHITQLKGVLDKLGGETYIRETGDKVFNDTLGNIDGNTAQQYLDACEAYVLTHPGTDSAAEYLYRASETARAVHSPEKCLQYYDQLIEGYPGNKRAIQALFLKGFTYDNDLHNFEIAKKYYEEFLQKYPDDEFASSAQFLLDNLGKSDDELLQVLQKKSAGQQKKAQ